MIPEVASNFEIGQTEGSETFAVGNETFQAEQLKQSDFLTETRVEEGRKSYKLQDSLVSSESHNGNEEMKEIMQGTLNKNSTPNFIVEN